MKNRFILFLIGMLMFVPTMSFAQQKSRKLTAYLQTKQFAAPQIGNYIEMHLQFVGHSINYLERGKDLIGEVAIIIDIEQNGVVVASDAYRLNTPIMVDGVVEDFYDIKRFALQVGQYVCRLELIDLNSTNPAMKANFEFIVDEFTDAIAVSDIIVAESAKKSVQGEMSHFFKSGYDIIPKIATFYPTELTMMPVYFEVYNSHLIEDSIFFVRQLIVDANSARVLNDFTRETKHKVGEVVPVFKTIDLLTLPTGKYSLKMLALDREANELASQTYDFERSNDNEEVINTADIVLDPQFQASIHEDSVQFYLASLVPISQPGQARTIFRTLKLKDKEQSRKLIQAIWKQTDPVNTYEAWMRYKEQVNYVQRVFKTHFQPGFETDRGRVYLQYGAPSRIIEREVSASELPYELWEYNKIGIYSNRKFIFYNPDLVSNTYRLLHSDMIGELKNPQWQYMLNNRNTTRGTVDNPNEYIPNSWGNNSRQLIGN